MSSTAPARTPTTTPEGLLGALRLCRTGACRLGLVAGSGTCRCWPRGLDTAARVVFAAAGTPAPRTRLRLGSAPLRVARRRLKNCTQQCCGRGLRCSRWPRVHLSLNSLWLFPVRRLRGFSLWFGWPAGAVRCVPSPVLGGFAPLGGAALRLVLVGGVSAWRALPPLLASRRPPRGVRRLRARPLPPPRLRFASLQGWATCYWAFLGARAVPVWVFCLPWVLSVCAASPRRSLCFCPAPRVAGRPFCPARVCLPCLEAPRLWVFLLFRRARAVHILHMRFPKISSKVPPAERDASAYPPLSIAVVSLTPPCAVLYRLVMVLLWTDLGKNFVSSKIIRTFAPRLTRNQRAIKSRSSRGHIQT